LVVPAPRLECPHRGGHRPGSMFWFRWNTLSGS
jgi:hypothetical protein